MGVAKLRVKTINHERGGNFMEPAYGRAAICEVVFSPTVARHIPRPAEATPERAMPPPRGPDRAATQPAPPRSIIRPLGPLTESFGRDYCMKVHETRRCPPHHPSLHGGSLRPCI